jgi:glycosyltransferase involved in cell wall biosynthesis
MTTPSVALIHDYLLVMRGAERSFATIADCWPGAPIYTLLHDPAKTEGYFAGHEVQTSYLQRLGVRQTGFRWLMPLFPRAAERLPVGEVELVISSTSAFAHGVRLPDSTMHIAYCYTPFRYAWYERDRALQEAPSALRPFVRRSLSRLRHWDLEASRRVDHYIAISELSRERIRNCYGRDATIVHPPVDVRRFSIGEPEDFFLVVTELVPHKSVDAALEAARRANVPITVVGGGPQLNSLSREYGSSATFLGRVSDAELADLYRRARALVLPNCEEFGIAAVEAEASGRPVLAVDAGGAKETVVPGLTGALVPAGDVDALATAMRDIDWERFEPHRVREWALRFSTTAFSRRFTQEVARLTGSADRPLTSALAEPSGRL